MACCSDRGMCLELKSISDNEQRLVRLLEKEYNEKIREITISSRLVQRVRNPLIKVCLDKIASHIAKDATIVSFLVSIVKEGKGSSSQGAGGGVTPEEVDWLRRKGEESIETYTECLHLVPDDKVRLMIKDLILGERHRCRIVKELWSMVFNDAIRRRRVRDV